MSIKLFVLREESRLNVLFWYISHRQGKRVDSWLLPAVNRRNEQVWQWQKSFTNKAINFWFVYEFSNSKRICKAENLIKGPRINTLPCKFDTGVKQKRPEKYDDREPVALMKWQKRAWCRGPNFIPFRCQSSGLTMRARPYFLVKPISFP